MKQRWFVILAAVALVASLAFACKKNENTALQNDTASTDTSTTSVSSTDTSATLGTTGSSSTGTTGTTSTGSTGGTVSSLGDKDKEFVMKAAEGGMAEVTLGQMVSPKASSPDVKNFADTMVTDHSKANDELKQLATTKGLALPTGPGAEHQKTIDELSKKSGKDLDKAYMDDMVKDHEKDVKEFEEASKNAQDPDVKAWAAKTLPVLQHHLQMAKDTQKKVK